MILRCVSNMPLQRNKPFESESKWKQVRVFRRGRFRRSLRQISTYFPVQKSNKLVQDIRPETKRRWQKCFWPKNLLLENSFLSIEPILQISSGGSMCPVMMLIDFRVRKTIDLSVSKKQSKVNTFAQFRTRLKSLYHNLQHAVPEDYFESFRTKE